MARSRAKRDSFKSFTIEGQGIVDAIRRKYKIDSLVKITMLGGSLHVILAECKHGKRPVEKRDEILALHSKMGKMCGRW